MLQVVPVNMMFHNVTRIELNWRFNWYFLPIFIDTYLNYQLGWNLLIPAAKIWSGFGQKLHVLLENEDVLFTAKDHS